MKLASKILASFAVMASFSSFAADLASVDTTAVTVGDVAAASELMATYTDGQIAVITQSAAGSVAFIDQTAVNAAVISQALDGGVAVILQTGEGNFAAIVQK